MLTYNGVTFKIGDKVALLTPYSGFPIGTVGVIEEIEDEFVVDDRDALITVVPNRPSYDRERFSCFVWRLERIISPHDIREMVIEKCKILTNKYNTRMKKKGKPCLSSL